MIGRRRPETPWLIAALLYYGLICVVSSLPGTVLQAVGFSIWDKAAHAVVFSVLGALIAVWLHVRSGQKPRLWSRPVFAAMLIAIVAGALDELHQVFVPNRTPSMGDVLADGVGATLGIVAATLGFRMLYRKKRQPVVPR